MIPNLKTEKRMILKTDKLDITLGDLQDILYDYCIFSEIEVILDQGVRKHMINESYDKVVEIQTPPLTEACLTPVSGNYDTS